MPAGATCAQVITPLAAGAIAVVQVVGPQALAAAEIVFRPRSGKPLGQYPPGHLAYGDFLDSDGAVLDDGLALWGHLPDGGAWAEFNLHGGVRIVQRLVRRLMELGVRLGAEEGQTGQVTGDVQPRQGREARGEGRGTSAPAVGAGVAPVRGQGLASGESPTAPGVAAGNNNGNGETYTAVSRRRLFSSPCGQHVCCVKDRAFGWLCPLDQWVQACLAEAATPRVVRWLAQQGTLWHRMVAGWRDRLTVGQLDEVRLQADRLLARGDVGSAWRGRTLAIIGPPNAGKSSIANRLAGQGVSLVADSPGTTRDWVGQPIALGGWPVQLVDTAGIRETDDPVEAEGVGRAMAQARAADVRLLVVDRSCAPSDSESWLVGQVGLKSTDTIAYAKSDLPAGRRPEEDGLHRLAVSARIAQVSSLTGAGWSELEGALLAGSGLSALQEMQSLVFCDEVETAIARLVSALDARERTRALAVLDDLAPVDGPDT